MSRELQENSDSLTQNESEPECWFWKEFEIRTNWFASGGTSDVFLARFKNDPGTLVAVKLLRRPEKGQKSWPIILRRFRDEPSIVPDIRGVVQPFLKEVVSTQDAPDWVSKRYTHASFFYFNNGTRLDKWRAKTQAELLQVLVSLADVLRRLHEYGAGHPNCAQLHRDVKSNNAFVDENRAVHLFDFGLAKTNRAEESLTQLTDRVDRTIHREEYLLSEVDRRTEIKHIGEIAIELGSKHGYRTTVLLGKVMKAGWLGTPSAIVFFLGAMVILLKNNGLFLTITFGIFAIAAATSWPVNAQLRFSDERAGTNPIGELRSGIREANYPTEYLQGFDYLQSGRFQDANTVFRTMRVKYPAYASVGLGFRELYQGRPAEAIPFFEETEKTTPEGNALWCLREGQYLAYLRVGELEKSKEYANKLLALPATCAQQHHGRFECNVAFNRFDEAKLNAKTAIKFDSSYKEVFVRRFRELGIEEHPISE